VAFGQADHPIEFGNAAGIHLDVRALKALGQLVAQFNEDFATRATVSGGPSGVERHLGQDLVPDHVVERLVLAEARSNGCVDIALRLPDRSKAKLYPERIEVSAGDVKQEPNVVVLTVENRIVLAKPNFVRPDQQS